VRFDRNIKDQHDPTHHGRISRRHGATCLTYIMENQTRRRDVIFKSSREIAGSCDLARYRLNAFLDVSSITRLFSTSISNNYSELAHQTTHLERAHDFITRCTDHPADDMSKYTNWTVAIRPSIVAPYHTRK